MSLLVEPIKADLHLSDTGVSLLLGLAFVLCFAVAGPPIGMLIDRRRRWRIIAGGVALWSLMTAGCAFAGNYMQLFLFRMGVGIGEATLNPAGYSLLPDLVPPRRLGLAIAIFGMGVFIGAGLALVIGGQIIGLLATRPSIVLPLIGTIRSWQAIFLVVASLGLPIALVARFMPEPVRIGAGERTVPPLGEVLAYFSRNLRPLGAVTLCWACILMAGYSVGAWLPSFMIRTYGWTAPQVGLWFGLIIVFAGGPGAICGGLLSDRAVARRENGRVHTLVILSLLAIPAALAFPLMPGATGALALAAIFAFLQGAASSAAPTALQEILPGRMRGLGSALALTVTTLLGLGLGPTLLALVTDYGFGDKAMLRYSLATVIPLVLLGATIAGLVALPIHGPLRRTVVGN